MMTLKAFGNEYSGSQAIKLILVNLAASVPLTPARGAAGKLPNCHISYEGATGSSPAS